MLEGIQSSLTKDTAGEAKLKVQVNEDRVGKAFRAELQRVRHKVQIKGFRVGKAPLDMIRRLHGRVISQNVTLALVDDSLRRVASAKGIWLPDDGTTPVSYAKMAEEGEAFSFTADLAGLLPVVKKMGEHKGLALNRFAVLPPDLIDRGVAQMKSDKATTLDTQLAQDVSGKDSVEELRSDVESRLLNGLNRRVMEEQVVAQLVASSEVKVPVHVVEGIVSGLIVQTVGKNEKLGKKALRDPELRESFRGKARSLAKIRAIQQEIATRENIAADKVIDFLIEQAEVRDITDVEEVKQMLAVNPATTGSGNDGREQVQAIVSVSRVELGTYTGLQVQRRVRKVTPTLVAAEIEAIRLKDAKLRPVAEGVKVGAHHMIFLSCAASVDGHPWDRFCFTKAYVLMGQQNLPEQLESGIVGMAASEEKEISTTFTNTGIEVDSKPLQKKVIFKVVVRSIFEHELSDLDTGSLARIRKVATERVTARLARWTQNNLEEQIGRCLVENSVFHIPQADLDRGIAESMQQGVFAGKLCKAESILSGSTLQDDYANIILNRAKVALLLEEIIRKEGMESCDDPLRAVMDFLLAKADIAVVADVD